MSDRLSSLRIVLVEPAGPLNVGSIARVMKNMGLSQLVLVNPQCDPVGDEARQMAVHAADLLTSAHIVATLPDALVGCQRAIATTARSRDSAIPLEPARPTLPWLLDAPSALIFGPEDRGLNNEELHHAQRWVNIPSSPDYPSLNLAQAVAVCCYDLYSHAQQSLGSSQPTTDTAPLDHLEGYFQHLETLLLDIGYLYPHTAQSRMEKLRGLYQRSQLSENEVALLRGMLRQIDWKLRQPS